MLSSADLTSIARARLKDAKALLSKRRHDGAASLCGYAVEIALKARIVKTLKWTGFPETRTEFEGLASFKCHDLRILLRLSGWEAKIRTTFLTEWSAVEQWNPEARYERPGGVTQAKASAMIESAKKIVGVLL
jgi:HEPN domain-containing protein